MIIITKIIVKIRKSRDHSIDEKYKPGRTLILKHKIINILNTRTRCECVKMRVKSDKSSNRKR